MALPVTSSQSDLEPITAVVGVRLKHGVNRAVLRARGRAGLLAFLRFRGTGRIGADLSLPKTFGRHLQEGACGLLNVLLPGPAQPAKKIDQRLVLGKTCAFGDQPGNRPVWLSQEDRCRHEFVTGATGSGKTNLLKLLLADDISKGVSVWVADVRGDLVSEIRSDLAASTDPTIAKRIHLLDFSREDLPVVGVNPLAGQAGAHSRALYVLGVLRSQSPSWGVTIEETTRHALVALAEYQGSLLDFEGLLTNKSKRSEILVHVSDPTVQAFFGRYDQLSEERQMSLYMPCLNKMSSLTAIPALRDRLRAQAGLDIDKLFNVDGAIVLVDLAAHRFFGAANMMGALLISRLQAATMARATMAEAQRTPVRLYLDEFQNLASDSLSTLIAEGRRYQCFCTLANQSSCQLSRELHDLLRTNVHAQYLFQTGNADASHLAHEVTSDEKRESVRSLLLRLPRGQALLIRRGQPTVHVRVRKAHSTPGSSDKVEELRRAANRNCLALIKTSERRINGARITGGPEVRHDQMPFAQ